jgi:hypothetical protein
VHEAVGDGRVDLDEESERARVQRGETVSR